MSKQRLPGLFKVLLRSRRGEPTNTVTIEAASASIGNRGDLFFYNSSVPQYISIVAAFNPGAWVQVTKMTSDEIKTENMRLRVIVKGHLARARNTDVDAVPDTDVDYLINSLDR